MPIVQYAHPQKSTNIVRVMPAPVKVSDINAWFKSACKLIPEIPAKWTRVDELITEKSIIFQLIHPHTHEKCAVVIKRK